MKNTYRTSAQQHFIDARDILKSIGTRMREPKGLSDVEMRDFAETCEAFVAAIDENLDQWAKSLP